jgi:hypothetical protein
MEVSSYHEKSLSNNPEEDKDEDHNEFNFTNQIDER